MNLRRMPQGRRCRVGLASVLSLALMGCHAADAVGPAAPVAKAPPPAAQPPTPPRLRLPDTVAPLSYQVELAIDPQAATFTGQVAIRLRVRAATDVFWLNGTELTVQDAAVEIPGAAALPARVVQGGQHFLGFALPRALPPGEATLRLRYSAALSERDSAGLFRQREGDDWYVFTDFEPIDARRAFPCFDEPSFKVPWQLSLRVPSALRAFTNSPVLNEAPAGPGHKLVRFAATPPLPSYLIALAVGPFDIVEAGAAGQRRTPVRILTPRGRAQEAAYAAQVTPQLLTRMEDYFGTPYPFDKLDLIAVPQIGGAMENPGLITFRQSLILASSRDQSLRFQRSFAMTAAHELAHQWFGDLVTMAFWDDIWLNESFASWLEAKVIAAFRPGWGRRQAAVQSRNGAMNSDSLLSARRIRQPIESENDIANVFDGITYNKGEAVLEMFESYLGEEAFRRGVHRYLAQHARGNATATDFLRALSAESQRDVTTPFSTFLDQAGVPLVSVALRCAPGATAPPTVSLAQQRYLPLGSRAGAAEKAQRWQIPVCVKYPGQKGVATTCTLLKDAEDTLALPEATRCPGWIMANAAPQGGAGGYYRVRYQGDLLRRLLSTPEGRPAAGAPAGQLAPEERLTVLADQIALVRTNDQPVAEVLALLPTLFKAPERHAVAQAAGLLNQLGALVAEEQRPALRGFLRLLASRPARALGWKPRPGEDEDTRLLRPVLLGLAAGGGQDPQLVADAGRLARAWLGDRDAVDADLVDLALGVAAQHGDLALFQRYREAAAREPERRARRRLYAALGGFRTAETAQATLDLLLSEEVNLRDATGALDELLNAPETRERAYRFLKERFDALVARLPRDSGAWLTRMAAGSFCSAAHREDLEAFFGPKAGRYAGGPRVLAQTLERISLCDALKQAQAPSLAAFLRKQP